MADEVVVKEYLSPEMMDAGRELTLVLEDHEVDIHASLWLYLSESNVWRLIIASPIVSTSGPKGLYENIHTLIMETPQKFGDITLLDISAVEPNSPLVAPFRGLMKIQSPPIGVRLSRSTFNGVFVEGAYIYKLT